MLRLGALARFRCFLGRAVITSAVRPATVFASAFRSVRLSSSVSLRNLPPHTTGGPSLRIRNSSSLIEGDTARVQRQKEYTDRAQRREKFLSQPSADVFCPLVPEKDRDALRDCLELMTVEDVLSLSLEDVTDYYSVYEPCFQPVAEVLSDVNERNCKEFGLEEAGKTIYVTTTSGKTTTLKIYSSCQLAYYLHDMDVNHLVLDISPASFGIVTKRRAYTYFLLDDGALYHVRDAHERDILTNIREWRKNNDSYTESVIQPAIAKQIGGTVIPCANDRSIYTRKNNKDAEPLWVTDHDVLIQDNQHENIVWIGRVQSTVVQRDDIYRYLVDTNLLIRTLTEEAIITPVEVAAALKGKQIRLLMAATYWSDSAVHRTCKRKGIRQVGISKHSSAVGDVDTASFW